MAKSLNTFVKSKMNRDLDARLVPNGEYREGRNINISKSEGSDVGALENVRGNEQIIQEFQNQLQTAVGVNNQLEIIGLFKDDDTSSLYMFITSWIDNSPDRLSRGYNGFNFIVRISVLGDVYTPQLLVKGSFLNFSKNQPILGFNIIENQLYWSDNRNQPRKINLDLANTTGAFNQPPNHQEDYYYTEDQISVAKFNPYEPIRFVKNIGGPDASDPADSNWQETWIAENEEYFPPFLTIPMTGLSAPINPSNNYGAGIQFGSIDPTPTANKSRFNGNLFDYIQKGGNFIFPRVRVRNADKPNGGTFYLYNVQQNASVTSQVVAVSSSKDNPTTTVEVPYSWLPGDLITFELQNPQYQSTFDGEREYLKDKFVRFSYRFKYIDNEYSLMAPFTQPLFVPKQYGAFRQGDEASAAINTDLAWFENLITSSELNVPLPELTYEGNNSLPGLEFTGRYKVKEIQILIKTSNDNNVYSIDSIPLSPINFDRSTNNNLCMLVRNTYSDTVSGNSPGWPYNLQFIYKYKGNKPFQVLPESDITRVSDATPVRSLTQEVGGNRLMYGNYQNSHGAPSSLDYECFVTSKIASYDATNSPPISNTDDTSVREYYSGTLKQGRTYQVGVVLSDRYGRQSNVILANNDAPSSFGNDRDKSTVYAPYGLSSSGFGIDNFWGDSLKVSFNEKIPSSIPSVPFYPGLYDSRNNPLGWYSYKIVVKQTEQEYYNVYLPGSLSGNVNFVQSDQVLTYDDVYKVVNISLFGDNINKIPKNTKNTAATDIIFNSETTLVWRVKQIVYNANDVTNNSIFTPAKVFPVVNIQSWSTFGPWTDKKGQQLAYPGGKTAASTPAINNVDALYNIDKNPFVATVDITPAETWRLGFTGSIQKQGLFARFLNVAETNPVISNLDIYWETTTSGLISELNDAIENGNSTDGAKGISTFLFEFQEKYPYDGIGIYPGTLTQPSTGAYLLQQDIEVIQNNGAVNSSINANIQITNVTSTTGGSIIPADTLFDLVQTKTSGVDGASANAWNIRLRDQFVSSEASVNLASVYQLSIQGNITFEFLVTVPTGIPLTITASASNNSITNNEPSWTFMKSNQRDWNTTLPTVSGSAPKGNPATVANALDSSPNPGRVSQALISSNQKVLMSPFIPVNKYVASNYGGGSYDSQQQATWWSEAMEDGWSMSIKGLQNAGETWTGGTPLGQLFEKKSGNWRIYPDRDITNSAVRMNDILASTDGQVGSFFAQTGWDFRYNNGSWAESNTNVIPYIRRCELAIFDNDDSWNSWSPTGIGEQGSVPRSSPSGAWKDFLIVGTQADGNGPHANSSLNAFGYWKFPFDIAIPNSANSPLNSSSAKNAYCLLVDLNNPPFVQFDEWDNGDFDPRGNLKDRDICVYRLTIGLKELWSGGLTNTSQEQVVYVKIYK